MAFGIPSALADSKAMISHTQAGSVNTADLTDANGAILDQTSYGATLTVSTDYYLKSGETWINGATNGQSGTSIVTASSLMSTNNAYQHVTETKRQITVPAS
jgi:hypothetical protein